MGPIGGTIADRFGKYRILFWTQGLAGVQALLLAGLELTGHLQLWELYILAVSLGLINMVDNPTRQTFIVEMVGSRRAAQRRHPQLGHGQRGPRRGPGRRRAC